MMHVSVEVHIFTLPFDRGFWLYSMAAWLWSNGVVWLGVFIFFGSVLLITCCKVAGWHGDSHRRGMR